MRGGQPSGGVWQIVILAVVTVADHNGHNRSSRWSVYSQRVCFNGYLIAFIIGIKPLLHNQFSTLQPYFRGFARESSASRSFSLE